MIDLLYFPHIITIFAISVALFLMGVFFEHKKDIFMIASELWGTSFPPVVFFIFGSTLAGRAIASQDFTFLGTGIALIATAIVLSISRNS